MRLQQPVDDLSEPPSSPKPSRRPVLRAVIGACAFLVLFGAFGAMQVLAARSHLLRGSREVTVAAAVLHDPLRLRDASARSALRAQLTRARSEFASARGDLFLWTPLLSHLGRLPWAGSQLEAASPAADVSFRTADAAVSLVDGLGPVLRVIDHRP